ncbi:MAG TPA: sulfite exporter TauE/SafE family protein [Actinomycetota bacterium]|nr:sulfite exporter TauE/SafE family protein [Actinomycetota bacterium]
MQTVGFLLSGLAAGIFSGALGVGGASVATPLIRLLGVNAYQAIGSTVPMIIPGSATGAWTYFRSGLIDNRAAAWTSLSGAVASFAGARSTRLFNGSYLMIATAAVIFFLGIRLFPERPEEKDEDPEPPRGSAAGFAALGVVSGFSSGLLGVGGGFLIVPAFIKFFRLPTKVALGTSLTVIAVTMVPNMLGHVLAKNIDWRVALLLCVAVIPGARFGARLTILSSERPLRITMAIAFSVAALLYAGYELGQLFS